jgi:hypothetical protein
MTRLLIAVLVATTHALKVPKLRALKARGGIDIQKVGTALIGLEGLVGIAGFPSAEASPRGRYLLS